MHLFRPIEASTLASMLRPIAVTPDQVENSEDPEADHEEDDSKRRHLLWNYVKKNNQMANKKQ